jgi:predicted MFS family arabinose efflux permease
MVWLVGLFSFQTVYAVQSLLPLWMRDFGASAADVGATVGATVLGIALLSPFVGMLSDAVGRKPIIVAALLVLALPTAAVASAHSLDAVVLLRFAQGLAIPGISVVMMAYIGEEFRHERIGRMMAAFVSGAVTGGFLGRLLPGHIAEWWDWRTAFVVLGLINVLGALLVLWLLPPSRNFRPHDDRRAALAALGRHLRNRALLAACGVGFCVLLAMVASFTYINVVLGHAPYSLSSGALANVFAVYLIGVAITPFAGRLIQRLGYRRALRLAMLASISGMALTLYPSLPVIIVGLTLASCGTFFAQAASISYIAASVQEGRSLASGLYNMTYYLGGAAGAWAGGIAFVHGGWGATVILVALSQVAAMAVAWLGWRDVASATVTVDVAAPGAD